MAGRVAFEIKIALCLATVGCASPRADRNTTATTAPKANSILHVALPDNSSRGGFDNPSTRPSVANGGSFPGGDGVVPAGYLNGPQSAPSGGGSLPAIPTAPGVDGRSSGPPPVEFGTNPHARSFPTATGAFLNLAPGESATDRAVELMKRIETLAQENVILRDRIRTLEANGVEREQALRETLRETDRATAEVQKDRAEFESLRAEITKLRDRARRVEDDEIETLKAILDTLKGLVPPPPDGK